MPGAYESGLRMVEHHLGRNNPAKQTRGQYPTVVSFNVGTGRVVRNAANRITGTASQSQSSVTAHGVRPEGEFVLDGRVEDLIMPLMAFFHNRKYTQITAPTPPTNYTEVGTFEFGMIDAKPDNSGIVVGTFNPASPDFKGLVAMSDVYTMGLEFLYGHGDLGDTSNGREILNFIANRLVFNVERGIDQWLSVTIGGFGRDADEVASFAEATWGPGTAAGDSSSQTVLTPDEMTVELMELNAIDVKSTFQPWLDSLSVELISGISGRDALGADSFSGLAITGRPSLSGSVSMGHVSSEFLDAMKNGHQFALTVRFTGPAANQFLEIKMPNLRMVEGFDPTVGDPGSDVTLEVPFVGVVDPTVAVPLVHVTAETAFDSRVVSFQDGTSLALK